MADATSFLRSRSMASSKPSWRGGIVSGRHPRRWAFEAEITKV